VGCVSGLWLPVILILFVSRFFVFSRAAVVSLFYIIFLSVILRIFFFGMTILVFGNVEAFNGIFILFLLLLLLLSLIFSLILVVFFLLLIVFGVWFSFSWLGGLGMFDLFFLQGWFLNHGRRHRHGGGGGSSVDQLFFFLLNNNDFFLQLRNFFFKLSNFLFQLFFLIICFEFFKAFIEVRD
jgi:hypothetical protein